MPGPVPYVSDKTVSWNYGGDIYYHGIKQDWPTTEEINSEEEDADIINIVGTSKITRSGRIFSPEIAPPKAVFGPVATPKVTFVPIIISASAPIDEDVTTPVIIPTNTPAAETRRKSIQRVCPDEGSITDYPRDLQEGNGGDPENNKEERLQRS